MGHHAIIGGDHEHDEVGDICPARTHSAEGRVAGGIEKGDGFEAFLILGMGYLDGIGTDVLGDAAGFTGNNVGFTDGIEQGGFAVVHVAHHGDDWRARLEILLVVLGIEFEFLLLNGCRGPSVALAFLGLKLETVFGAKLFGGGLVNGLIDIGKHTELHEIGNQLERLAVDGLSQLAHHDGRLERDDGRIGLRRETRRTGSGRVAGRLAAGRGFLLVFLFLAPAGFTSGRHAA